MARGKKRAAAASAEEDAVVDAAAEMLPMVQRMMVPARTAKPAVAAAELV